MEAVASRKGSTALTSSAALGRLENHCGATAMTWATKARASVRYCSLPSGVFGYWKRGSVFRKTKKSCSEPSKPTLALMASISAWMRATSSRPIWWI
ncbi:hypothetical protein D3C72_1567780 [compost metagenome]